VFGNQREEQSHTSPAELFSKPPNDLIVLFLLQIVTFITLEITQAHVRDFIFSKLIWL